MDPTEVARAVQDVDIDVLRKHVETLAGSERSNHDRHGEPLDYLHRNLEAYGLHVGGHAFDYEGRVGVNLIGRKAGGRPDLSPLLLCAHYDSVPGSPGADDNASGVAAMLECARVLSSPPLPRPIDFVALDMEEEQPEGEGLVGSHAFVQEIARSRGYAGVYNLEMVGYSSGPGTQSMPPGFSLLFPAVHQHLEATAYSGESLAAVCQEDSVFLAEAVAAAGRTNSIRLDVVQIALGKSMPVPRDVFRSDHAAFWTAGTPAIMLTDTANFRNPNYHTPFDTPDTLDYAFLWKVTAALVSALAVVAGR